MADYHYDSAGSNTAPYDTWTKAATTHQGVGGSNDNHWYSTTFSYLWSSSSHFNFNPGGGNSGLAKMFSCTKDTGDDVGPLALQAGAVFGSSSGWDLIITSPLFAHLMRFKSQGSFQFGNAASGPRIILDNCFLELTNSGGAGVIALGGTLLSGSSRQVTLRNTDMKFAHTGSGLWVRGGSHEILGGKIESGSAAITTFVADVGTNAPYGASLHVLGFDFTNAAQGLNLVNAAGMRDHAHVKFANCVMPAGWTGSITTGSFGGLGMRVEMFGCSVSGSDDSILRDAAVDSIGGMVTDTNVYRATGAQAWSSGTRKSWKCYANAVAHWPGQPFYTPWMYVWVDTTGSKTITLELLHNGTALKDTDVGMEVAYGGTTTSPLDTVVEQRGDITLAQASGSTLATGQGTGGNWTLAGTPLSQKISKTITVNRRGYVKVRALLYCGGRTNIYVCPKPDVT